MSNFAPRAVFTPHHFEIAENARGYWVAKDKEGLIGGVFRTRKDALGFALFEVAGDSAYVRGRPATGAASGAKPFGMRYINTMAEREERPSPEALLAAAKQEGRGRLMMF